MTSLSKSADAAMIIGFAAAAAGCALNPTNETAAAAAGCLPHWQSLSNSHTGGLVCAAGAAGRGSGLYFRHVGHDRDFAYSSNGTVCPRP
jgi:hypothetical protein